MLELLMEIKKVMDNFLPFALGMIGFWSIFSTFEDLKPKKERKRIVHESKKADEKWVA